MLSSIAAAAALACGAPHAAPAAVGPPTSALAWRARVIEPTPVRRYIARPATRALDPAVADTVLVLDSRADARGRCWLRVRVPGARTSRRAGSTPSG